MLRALPKPERIAQQANRYHQRLWPAEPTDLDFSLKEQHLPEDSLKKDLSVNGRHNLVFATAKQLVHLSTAKTWYINGTFELVCHPFMQLLTIITSIREDYAKQVRLVFVLMSGKKKHYRTISTVLYKSNASKFCKISWLFGAFQGNFALSEISSTFVWTFEEPIVSIWPNFHMIIHCGH